MLSDFLRGIYRWLASVRLAVILLVTLAGVLAWATLVESTKGRDYSQWFIYRSPWFLMLLTLLGVNVLAAALIRFPWKRRQIGFLITHAGLLVLLAGAIITYYAGMEGSISVAEGETADRIHVTERSQFTVFWRGAQGKSERLPAAFIFEAGPNDWPANKTLDLGEFGGARLRVLRFLRRARAEETWLRDEARQSGPALKLAFSDPTGKTVREDWLVASAFAGELDLGMIRLELRRATVDTMLDDFLKPPAADMDASGVLSMHYQGKIQRIPVGPNVGKKTPFGDLQIEIVRYLPDARQDERGQFAAAGKEAKNPMVELRVHVPGGKEPVRQMAFASDPTMDFELMHSARCPVKFWYHHPALSANKQSLIRFLQTTDGKLYYRQSAKDGTSKSGAVDPKERFVLGAQFQLAVAQHLPHARKQVTFHSTTAEGDEQDAATELEVTSGGATARFWLKRNDPAYSDEQFMTADGILNVHFGYERVPLGFALKLLTFHRGLNPGGMGDASFASSVRLIDKQRGIDETREVSMNSPLSHGKFTFYQSSFSESPGEKPVSIFTAAYDPGLMTKYVGSLMICLGSLVMFLTRASARRAAE